jgi:hypothetical protein
MPLRSQHQLYYTRRKPLHPEKAGPLAHRKQAASMGYNKLVMGVYGGGYRVTSGSACSGIHC